MNNLFPSALRLVSAALFMIVITSVTQAQVAREDDTVALTAEKLPWSVRFIVSEEAELKQEKYKPDGRGAYMFLADEESGLNISVYVEAAQPEMTASAYRDVTWERTSSRFTGSTDVAKSDKPAYAAVEFILPEFQKMQIQQKNMNVHFVKDGYWVHVHISKVLFTPEDQPLFDSTVGSIAFVAK